VASAGSIPEGQPGQPLTLEFVQRDHRPGTIPASAWPPNVILTNGAFVMPSGQRDVATISFQWDPAGRRGLAARSGTWVETGRSNAGPLLTGDGAPEGHLTAPPGALFVRADGTGPTLLYRKAQGTGATGWVVMPSQGLPQANSVAQDVAGLREDVNALLAKLRQAGVLAP